MKDFLKDFDTNFWKYIVIIILIIMLSFSVKWTHCLCNFSDAAVRFFDNNSRENFTIEHGIFDDIKKKATSTIDKAKSKVSNVESESAGLVGKSKGKLGNIESEDTSLEGTATDLVGKAKGKLGSIESEAAGLEDIAKGKLGSIESEATGDLNKYKTQEEEIKLKAKTEADKQELQQLIAQNKLENRNTDVNSLRATAKRQLVQTNLEKQIEKEEAQQDEQKFKLIESFTSNANNCKITSPHNITAGYMNSIDHDINDLCNHPNPNDCSLVKTNVTGGTQYIESKSLRKQWRI